MVLDKETDALYISNKLREQHSNFYQSFSAKIEALGVYPNILNNTKDIWCRDYMPIQKSKNLFLQFAFNPSYLNFKKYEPIKTNPKEVWDNMGLSVIESDIIIDGGNIVKGKNKAVITDRVIKDNPSIDEKVLFNNIKQALEVKQLIVIPELNGEMTGHSDGILRFIAEDEVVINDFSRIDKKYSQKLKFSLLSAGLKYIELPNEFERAENTMDDRGDYVNFLEMRDFVLIPSYGTETDEVALSLYKSIFSDKIVENIACSEIAAQGGALNCITWNIKD